jgi:glycosyltransferase involved in cell wall biosynthesis
VLPAYLSSFRRAVRSAEAEFRPDVVSVHWWAPGALATAGIRTPVAVTGHGSDVRLLGQSALFRMIGRQVLKGAAGVSAVSETMAADLRNWGGVDRVALTPMPVDDARFAGGGPRALPPVVLFAGNIIRAKGVDLIIRAAGELHQAGVEFRLRLVGDGPDRGEFERLATELGVSGIVEWAGAKGHDEMPGEFARASIFVRGRRDPCRRGPRDHRGRGDRVARHGWERRAPGDAALPPLDGTCAG